MQTDAPIYQNCSYTLGSSSAYGAEVFRPPRILMRLLYARNVGLSAADAPEHREMATASQTRRETAN
jgi:hypothetical protein